ncbi:DUF1302 family protein [Motiliproteus coralliicola]|uniref:DUF1302 family protein n=1 Tax=Motiliproteus coralliicola TaxID=2283196 RepID=A0A369WRF0_9GAMM|nr:DUF1302 family protein [Motiliproteus coralliicola]RDE24670.1 DUF1302 family protein [Motiliproteus coralliicola]
MFLPPRCVRHPLAVAVASASVSLLTSGQAQAIDLNFDPESDWSGQLDVTLGYATSFRAQDRDPDIVGLGQNDLSELRVPDKGDRISQVFSAAFELGLDWRNYGLNASAVYQHDTEIMSGDSIDPLSTTTFGGVGGGSNDWSDAAEDHAGNTLDLLDAYVYGSFELADNPLEVRVGKQVINWGEGLFFLDGIGVQVPLNVNKLTTPGSELKHAYIGNNAFYAQLGVGDESSIEAYIQTEWNRAEMPPQGTFYGVDPLYRGGSEKIQGSGAALGLPGDVSYRDGDDEASDSGQWGVSGRTVLGDTEVGLYYSRYHETFAFAESTFDATAFGASGGAVCSFTSALCARHIWPEDLDMLGASFATTLAGIAVAGEIAFRPDRPLMNLNAGVGAFGAAAGSQSIEEHDTLSASVNAIWLGRGGFAGIDSQQVIAQFGVDHIGGDTSNLTPHNSVSRDKNNHNLATTKTADSTAYGVAVQWEGTWQAVRPATDLTLSVFVQHDINGISHFYGNFAEGRTQVATTLTADIGSEWEASLGYIYVDHEESDYEDLDSINFSVNYKF